MMYIYVYTWEKVRLQLRETTKGTIVKLFVKIINEFCSVIFVSHSLDEFATFTDRAAISSLGRS